MILRTRARRSACGFLVLVFIRRERNPGCGTREALRDVDEALHLGQEQEEPACEQQQLSRVRERVQPGLLTAGEGRTEAFAAVVARGCDFDLAARRIAGIGVALEAHRTEPWPALADPEDGEHRDPTRLHGFGHEESIEWLRCAVHGWSAPHFQFG